MPLTEHHGTRVGQAALAALFAQAAARMERESSAAALVVPLANMPTNVFWPSLLRRWHNFGCTWPELDIILPVLRFHSARMHARLYMCRTEARAFDSLPHEITVYRGCARCCVPGLHWTINRAVANRYPQPSFFEGPKDRHVVVSATIRKPHVFLTRYFGIDDELILDPSQLRAISIETEQKEGD